MASCVQRYRQEIVWAVMALAIALVAAFLPQGFDYAIFFGPHYVPVFSVPWTDGLLYLLSWPILVSITIMSLVIAIQRNGGAKWLILPAVFSLPTIWALFLGSLEGVTLAGLLLLRYAVPARLIENIRKRNRVWWIALFLLGAATLLAAVVIGNLQGPRYNLTNSTVLGQQPPWDWP